MIDAAQTNVSHHDRSADIDTRSGAMTHDRAAVDVDELSEGVGVGGVD
jgi:hypothetical protein